MAKILLADDDLDLALAVVDWLRAERHAVEHVLDGQEASERLDLYNYDMAILDWNMPGLTGPAVCQQYRSTGGKIPILLLTSRAQLEEKEQGLDAGADDYLTKPFELRELSARVRALSRRLENITGNLLTFGDLSLDRVSMNVKRGERVIQLLPKEFALLEFFMKHPGQVFSLETLLNRIWQSDSDSSPETVRVHLTNLRSKIDKNSKHPVVQTVYGVGYKLEET